MGVKAERHGKLVELTKSLKNLEENLKQIQEVQDVPKRSQLFKIDYVPTDRDRFYVRGKTWLAQQQGFAVAGGSTPVGFFGQCYCFTESGLGVGGTHIFSPNKLNEIRGGVAQLLGRPDLRKELQVPGVNITGTSGFSGALYPSGWWQTNYDFKDIFSWVHKTHNIKIGGELIN